ncbi:MAG: M55 family metallopeptidase [Okeania sp. SIO3B3]|nr:M55 family metallopeptidase [Okeania sp. SIO3B3]
MNIFICADIEGVGCVVRHEHSRPGQREYEQARRWMTNEVNAAVETAFANGAKSVTVADSHNVGLNLIPDMLHPKTRLVMGSPRPLSMMEGIQEGGFDGVIFVGAHAMGSTINANICHNFHGRVQYVQLNGVTVGELGLNAALAGHYNTPVLLVTGDEAACLESQNLMPDVPTVAVKQPIGAYAANTLMPSQCVQLIAQATQKAMAPGAPKCVYKLQGDVLLEMTFTTASSADRAAGVPRAKRVDALRVSYHAENVVEAFQAFHTMVDLLELIEFI